MKIWRNVMFVVFLTVFAAGRYAHLGACGVFLDVMEEIPWLQLANRSRRSGVGRSDLHRLPFVS